MVQMGCKSSKVYINANNLPNHFVQKMLDSYWNNIVFLIIFNSLVLIKKLMIPEKSISVQPKYPTRIKSFSFWFLNQPVWPYFALVIW